MPEDATTLEPDATTDAYHPLPGAMADAEVGEQPSLALWELLGDAP